MNAPMALRLIDAPEPPRPSAYEAVPAARLVPAAAGRVAANDWPGYRAVVAEAGEIADPHRRYEARRALLELGLREGSNVATLVATAVAAVDMLQAEPRDGARWRASCSFSFKGEGPDGASYRPGITVA